jgi:hypothetical protein
MSLKAYLPILIAGIAVMAACNPPPPKLVPYESRSSPCVLSAESYAVYDAVLKDFGVHQYPGRFDRPNLVVLDVAKGSGVSESFWRANKRLAPARDTLSAFNNLIGSSCRMEPPPESLIRYKLISEGELRTIFMPGVEQGWSKFYKMYPQSNGYWDFSPVGFNNVGNQALIYVGHHCGGLCGTGYFVVLQKKGDHWAVTSDSISWVS